MALNRNSLSKGNLQRHTREQELLEPITDLNLDLEDTNHLFQKIRLDALFVKSQVIEKSESSNSSSSTDPWAEDRGRKLTIDPTPSRVRNTRSPEFLLDPNYRRPRRISSVKSITEDIESSEEEIFDSSMLNKVKIIGKDDHGVSTIFDPNDNSLLLNTGAHNKSIRDRFDQDLQYQNSDNEISSSIPLIVYDRKRKATPLSNVIPARSELKRTRSAGPRISSGRKFKTPKIQKQSDSFDLKFPKFS